MTASVPVIRVERASKAFPLPEGGRFDAVRDVSLDILPGEIFGLVGRSGAGKSTLLRLMNLLEKPDSGSISVAGQELTALGARELREARRRIGMIYQHFNLLANATVFENVAFPLRIHGAMNAPRLRARVTECLELVGLLDKAGSYPARLSVGQKQRVAIARALASYPTVLLCDEPTSALDPDTTRSVLDTLRDINARLGVTIVIVSHELQALGSLCQRAAVVEDGRIAELFDLRDHREPRKTSLGRELLYHATEAHAAEAHAAAVHAGLPPGELHA
ncbi:methionine ABC transporter ATP-binding protein [Massilia arenae]|uniref:Methionine ABC transporter ATP-binding protein n=1 Tax=Massilia arenae TaxID=2603288 RepID=A0A5C7G1C2_9BURK|nr:methionine ABC transporter ATP-binding protein [Massilia arenae]TXF96422.1 methionine ABC transporter ATP-binding protein [Massilia arenae]